MQIKLIFTTKVSHLASFWKWEFLELRNGLFWSLIVSPQPYPAQQKQHYFPPPHPPPANKGAHWLHVEKFVLAWSSVHGRAIFVVQCFVSVSADIVLSTWQSLFC